MSRSRVHVLLPRELTEEIDALVGQRKRSSFISEAAREKLIRHKQGEGIANIPDRLGTLTIRNGGMGLRSGSTTCVEKIKKFETRVLKLPMNLLLIDTNVLIDALKKKARAR